MKVFTLAAVVAALDSGTAAQAQGFACDSDGWLIDRFCRLDDISRVFGGALNYCSFPYSVIFAYKRSDCEATADGINNHPDYDGPTIKCVSTFLTSSFLLLFKCVR